MARPAPAAPRILILKPSSLGDIVHGLPVLAGLRHTWPDAHIAWLVGRSFASLLDGHPHLDEIIVFDRKRLGAMGWNPAAFIDFWRLVARLQRGRFDWVIDLQGLARSGLLSWFSGARRRVGFASARELAWLFYTLRVTTPIADEHAIEKNLRVLEALGAARAPDGVVLPIRDEDREAAARLLRERQIDPHGDFVAVLPGARWDSKRWPPGNYVELIERLWRDASRASVLLGASDERALCDEIAGRCSTPVANLAGRTHLMQLAAVLERASLVVSQDSGPMHLAAALDRPLVALFGPTSPLRTGPHHPAARVVRLSLPCSPCYRRRCPLGHHACMKDLSVAALLEALAPALASAAPSAIPPDPSSEKTRRG